MGALALQNFIQRLGKQISQRNIALVVETARHHCAVGEHTELIAQAVAELRAALRRVEVGPVELLRVLKIQVFP